VYMDKAVILTRGLGTRMQKADDSAELTGAQLAIAKSGVKAMIPIKRPFLDYVITVLAKAGYRRICLVIGPEHQTIRQYYESIEARLVSIDFAIQEKPLGTADAVLPAEGFADEDDFIVINSDNFYPLEAVEALLRLDGPGLVAFERSGLLAAGDIEPERILQFAVVQVDDNGCLARILEKPTPEQLAAIPEPVCVSMNCWRFNRKIFTACRSIRPSTRGELELPDAVQYAIDSLGERFRVVRVRGEVLDLSSRKCIKPVAEKLADMEVSL
jgi:dTDP-glucose pyrophosphorylase